MPKFSSREPSERSSATNHRRAKQTPGAKKSGAGNRSANTGEASSHVLHIAILAVILILIGAVVALLVRDRSGMTNLLSEAQRLVSSKKIEWREVPVADTGCSIQMPGDPIRSSKTMTPEGGAGAVQATTYEAQVERARYKVLFYDLQTQPASRAEVKAFFKRVTEAGVSEFKGTLVSDKAAPLGPWPGREVHVENEREAIRSLLFLVNGRVYHLAASAPREQILTNDVEWFLASFKLPTPDGKVWSPHDAAADRWIEFSPAGGRFEVELPGLPSIGQETVATSAGGMVVNRFELEREEFRDRFSVQYADYPEQLLRQMKTTDAVLSGAASADIDRFKGKLVSEKTLTREPYPAKELYIENAEAAMRLRMYLVNGRLYKLQAVRPKNMISTVDDEKFMSSFSLVTP